MNKHINETHSPKTANCSRQRSSHCSEEKSLCKTTAYFLQVYAFYTSKKFQSGRLA